MTESSTERNRRLNAASANTAHADGRHGPGAAPADRQFWAAMGCTACVAALTATR